MFQTDIDCRFVYGKNEIEINGVLRYWSPRFQQYFTADHGFICDLASIPRAAWSLLGIHPFDYRIRRGAVLHDAGYRGLMPELTRRQIDKLLYDCCIEDGMERDLAKLIYIAVRTGGSIHYKGV